MFFSVLRRIAQCEKRIHCRGKRSDDRKRGGDEEDLPPFHHGKKRHFSTDRPVARPVHAAENAYRGDGNDGGRDYRGQDRPFHLFARVHQNGSR